MGPCANMQLDLSEFKAFKVVYESTEINQLRVSFSELVTEKKIKEIEKELFILPIVLSDIVSVI